MGCTVAELAGRMSAVEFGRWAAYWAEEPPPAAAWQVALPQLLAMIARAGGLQRPDGSPPQPADFAGSAWQPRQPPPDPTAALAGLCE